jgi:hypothetical protein
MQQNRAKDLLRRIEEPNLDRSTRVFSPPLHCQRRDCKQPKRTLYQQSKVSEQIALSIPLLFIHRTALRNRALRRLRDRHRICRRRNHHMRRARLISRYWHRTRRRLNLGLHTHNLNQLGLKNCLDISPHPHPQQTKHSLSVASPGIGPLPNFPYPKPGGIVSVLASPGHMSNSPWSQPLITCPAPSLNVNGTPRSKLESNWLPSDCSVPR